MNETVTVRLPDRAWAECASQDLIAEGLSVRLSDSADCDGLWALDVSGCSEKVRAIRQCLQPALPPFDWASCVNGWLDEAR